MYFPPLAFGSLRACVHPRAYARGILARKYKSEKGVIDEIVDIQELLDTLIKETGLTKEKISKEQNKKRFARGGFKKKLFLVKVKK